MTTIELHGGPFHGRRIVDSGVVTIRLGIAAQWHGDRPAIGSPVGLAVYEPTECRARAHWLENQWDGVVEEVIEAAP